MDNMKRVKRYEVIEEREKLSETERNHIGKLNS